MPERLIRAKRFRGHAESLRNMGENWADAKTLRQLRQLADEYDEMAENLEKAAKAAGLRPDRD
jgi:hypothetical protein